MSSETTALVPTVHPSPSPKSDTLDLEQAERVLGRAAALQQKRARPTLTVDELTEAAQEAGIEPAFVQRALEEIRGEENLPARRAGMQTRLVRRRWFDRSFDRATTDRLLARLDAFFGAQGTTTHHECGASWSARHVHITVEAQGEGTLVTISERFVNTASQLASLGVGGGGVFGLALVALIGKAMGLGALSVLFGLPFIALFSAIGLWAARHRHTALVTDADRQFHEALDTIERLLSEG